MTQDELNETIRRHHLWMTGKGGQCADFSRQDLSSLWFEGARLDHANFVRADLNGAMMQGCALNSTNFFGAYVSRANLSRIEADDANFAYADLACSDLCGASFNQSNLSRVDLTSTDCSKAMFTGANLYRAYVVNSKFTAAELTGTNLYGVTLKTADLSEIQRDFYSVLDIAKTQAPGLLAVLREGRIDGGKYIGECSCLKGTIASLRRTYVGSMDDLKTDPASPAERWFTAIRPGDTPLNNEVSRITAQWITDWMIEHA